MPFDLVDIARHHWRCRHEPERRGNLVKRRFLVAYKKSGPPPSAFTLKHLKLFSLASKGSRVLNAGYALSLRRYKCDTDVNYKIRASFISVIIFHNSVIMQSENASGLQERKEPNAKGLSVLVNPNRPTLE